MQSLGKRRSLDRYSRPRSSPDGATDDDLPELEMDDIFGGCGDHMSVIDASALSEKQLVYIEKLKRLCNASPFEPENVKKLKARRLEEAVSRMKHSASFDSARGVQEWQGVVGLESPLAGMSKVNSCESFASYASTD